MRLLILADTTPQISQAAKIALDQGAKVDLAGSLDITMQSVRGARCPDLLLVDVRQPIARLIADLTVERVNLPVAACGVNASAEQAANAIRAGAQEFIPLPPDAGMIGALLALIAKDDTSFICTDEKSIALRHLAKRIAPSDATVMISGESGTGKECVARYIHQNSTRSSKPFVCINCAAIPVDLLESEMFGHEKGAFTGAQAQRIGRFEQANGGTLLLDEITELHVNLQAKLLRALQERVIDRIGGSKPEIGRASCRERVYAPV